MSNGFDPGRFLAAQEPVYDSALGELRAGQKRTHWMWFIFPQIAGLGHSPTSQFYALPDLAAAQVYAAHAVLGARLLDCTEAVLLHAPGTSAPKTLGDIFGAPDDRKFHSSMTLFHRATPEDPLFARALAAFFDGVEDANTLSRLAN